MSKAGNFNVIIGSPKDSDIHTCFSSPPLHLGFTRWSPELTDNDKKDSFEWTPKEAGFYTDICDYFYFAAEKIKYPQLLKELGIFTSNSQAKKNGWNKDIEEGFSDIKIGRRRVCILKITPGSK